MNLETYENFYVLYEGGEKIMETTSSCVEKAMNYFNEMGYDVYANRDLKINLEKKMIRSEYCPWDAWHPNF
jgi:hypothetical protein